MSFYGYRSPEMLREIAKWTDGWDTVTHATLHSYRRHLYIPMSTVRNIKEMQRICT